jgi:lipopolysaccharide/colanic/teichoic acid biosynthesis glycosyltransferase
MYAKCFKRFIDFTLSLAALILLSPVLLLLTIIGAIAMGGNPFFTQLRPGRIDPKTGEEKIFKLVKFRSMNNRKDANGNLLPDDIRLSRYGRILRSTSLDELPELWNILRGDMAIVGPRPLLVEYLPYYTQEERRRHTVRPGLTGWAQVNGRNNIRSWEERFQYDLEYIRNCSLIFDLKILFMTVAKVFKRSDILVGNEIKVGRLDDARRAVEDESNHQKV